MTAENVVPFLDLRRQHRLLRADLDAAIDEVLTRADFIKGSAVGRFEEAFAEYQGAGHSVGVANGTDALEIALEALDLPPGSEAIVPANSFIASSEAVTRAGLGVVFADVDETFTMDVGDAARRITDRTSAIVAVHLYGQPANLAALRELCDQHGLRLVEDAAQAHGAEFRGQRVGALGDIGTFSFFPGKNLGAIGDAGAIVTNDVRLANTCRRIANHGRIAKYDHDTEGRNSRMDTIQAAVLEVKLSHLDEWIGIRNAAADHYRLLVSAAGMAVEPDRVSGIDPSWAAASQPGSVRLPSVRPDIRHAYHLFVVRVADRDGVRGRLASSGIATGVHYPTILPRLGAYRAHPQHSEPFRCDAWADELLSLPIGDHMDEGLCATVVRALVDSA